MLKEVGVPQEEASALKNLKKNSRRRERNAEKNRREDRRKVLNALEERRRRPVI
jgi:hypothetical protein